ncbi:hypothetical protein ACFMJX_27105, partial [Acinetobacter baumannii]
MNVGEFSKSFKKLFRQSLRSVAVQDALNDSNGIWLGWNGQQITDTEAPEFDQAYSHGIDYITCPLTHQQYAQYY